MTESIENSRNQEERGKLIKHFPCFAKLSPTQLTELTSLMEEVNIIPQVVIVREHEIVNSIYIIVSGEAEVTRETAYRKNLVNVPVASLRAGESIGLNDTGFYSSTGKRTATVTAITSMQLLRLDIKDLYAFLHNHHLELAMHDASLQMLRMQFIKQSLPFVKLSHDRLIWLADRVEELTLPPDTLLFNQGEEGDRCYLIRSGQVEVYSSAETGTKSVFAILKPPAIFGEATMITHTPRNATARTLEASEFLVLKHEYLSELIESEDNVADMFMTLTVDRSRPLQNPNITVHNRTTADGQELTILKNSETHTYFKLSGEGFYIWQQLDGKHTLQDITLNLADQFQVFAPNVVTALISKLTKAGFITNLELHDHHAIASSPLWVRGMVRMQKLLDMRYSFGDADKWVSNMYQRYIRYFFTTPGLVFLAFIILIGISAFIYNTGHILAFFNAKKTGMLLALLLIPLSFFEFIMHEMGHAFAVKAMGREVHYIGIGWGFSGPVAFTDTSDMWLSDRKSRMIVNFSGVIVDIIMAGFAALLIFVSSNPYLQATCWLFALYTYIGAFRMLSPLQEWDGYFVLMDWLERPRLRHAAVMWLVKKFPLSIKQPRLFKENKAEIAYWIICIAYLIFMTFFTLLIQKFLFKILGIQPSSPWKNFILPLFVVAFSSLSIIAEIKSRVEE